MIKSLSNANDPNYKGNDPFKEIKQMSQSVLFADTFVQNAIDIPSPWALELSNGLAVATGNLSGDLASPFAVAAMCSAIAMPQHLMVDKFKKIDNPTFEVEVEEEVEEEEIEKEKGVVSTTTKTVTAAATTAAATTAETATKKTDRNKTKFSKFKIGENVESYSNTQRKWFQVSGARNEKL